MQNLDLNEPATAAATSSEQLLSRQKLCRLVPFDERAIRFHRSGWKYAHQLLEQLNCSESHIELYEMLEFDLLRKRSLQRGNVYGKWIGISHLTWRQTMLPDGVSSTPDMLFVDSLVETANFARHFAHCLALVTFSEHTAEIWRQKLGEKRLQHVPVYSLAHPTQTAVGQCRFSLQNYAANSAKQIIQIGSQLRRIQSIFELDAAAFQKCWLPGRSVAAAEQALHKCGLSLQTVEKAEVRIEYVSDQAYDKLLSENVAFVDLYDASANNAVIECMMRGTPLLVRRLPAVAEYLGPAYPYYFETLQEAAQKLCNEALLIETANYMQAKQAHWTKKLSGQHFLNRVEEIVAPCHSYWQHKTVPKQKRIFPMRRKRVAKK